MINVSEIGDRGHLKPSLLVSSRIVSGTFYMFKHYCDSDQASVDLHHHSGAAEASESSSVIPELELVTTDVFSVEVK